MPPSQPTHTDNSERQLSIAVIAALKKRAKFISKNFALKKTALPKVADCLIQLVRTYGSCFSDAQLMNMGELRKQEDEKAILDEEDILDNSWMELPLSLFVEVLQASNLDTAERLIKQVDLSRTVHRIDAFEQLTSRNYPLHTLPELAFCIRRFIAFLKRHRKYLITSGLPPTYFRECRWLHVQLGRLYDTRRTSSPFPEPELRNIHDEGRELAPSASSGSTGSTSAANLNQLNPFHDAVDIRKPIRKTYPYKWVRWADKGPDVQLLGSDLEEVHSIAKADLLPGMKAKDAHRIELKRKKFFELKCRILERAALALEKDDPKGLWDDCLSILKSSMHAQEITFLSRMDCYYLGNTVNQNLFSGVDPNRSPGGLTNLIVVIGHVEAELSFKITHDFKSTIPFDALQYDSNQKRRYYTFLSNNYKQAIDCQLDRYISRLELITKFWSEYRKRLRTALKNEIPELVPVRVLPMLRGYFQGKLQDLVDARQTEFDKPLMLFTDSNKFKKVGNIWDILYEGTPAKGMSDRIGNFYISTLLRNASKKYSGKELKQLYGAYINGGASHTLIYGDNVDAHYDEMTDNQLNKAREQYSQESERAKYHGNPADAAEYEEKISKIDRYLKLGKYRGKMKNLKDRSKSSNDAVRSAIDRALILLKDAHPALHTHLKQQLHIGNPFSYKAVPGITWES